VREVANLRRLLGDHTARKPETETSEKSFRKPWNNPYQHSKRNKKHGPEQVIAPVGKIYVGPEKSLVAVTEYGKCLE